MGSWVEAVADEEHASAVVVAVAEAADDAAVGFDQAVEGLGVAVVGPDVAASFEACAVGRGWRGVAAPGSRRAAHGSTFLSDKSVR